jgi:hypothetical protein
MCVDVLMVFTQWVYGSSEFGLECPKTPWVQPTDVFILPSLIMYLLLSQPIFFFHNGLLPALYVSADMYGLL